MEEEDIFETSMVMDTEDASSLEDMKKDKAVYKAVRSAIQTAHMEDGASMADITKETNEQKKEGRIRYLVVAEEQRVGQSEQEGQNDMGTRGSRDAGGGRSQRVKTL